MSGLKQRYPLSAYAENLRLETSLPDTHRNVQVLQMPQALKAEMTFIDAINKTTTTSDSPLDRYDNDEDDEEAEDEQNDDCTSSSAESSPRSSSQTFSLKLVVSTQNAVAATSSSASREHTHHA